MDQKDAMEIANLWKYPDQYSFYDMTEDVDDYNEIVDPKQRENYFSIKENGSLIGYFVVDSNDDSVTLGLGMRPELTGQGKGESFLNYIISFIVKKYKPTKIKLSVVDFNKRAMKVYKKCGFKETGTSMLPSNGSVFNFVHMERKL
ncbi:GNAT family N-acetyltransferase [Arcanobacterium phocae]|uniref:GNAT family N-acetyltransferase n=1 Tax=Arcanobacterium phocae TaxID=131112 RepID=UPI001C0E913D|nr:GNAT family N-acetyltransferase [Arcanobacterium phocae]